VGTQSFGKGIMQTLFALDDGSAVNLTTAKIYPYSGVSFHETGIAPGYEVTMTKEQEQLILADDHSDDPQLEKALEVLSTQN
jgi:carboxyl-terminal processing protease